MQQAYIQNFEQSIMNSMEQHHAPGIVGSLIVNREAVYSKAFGVAQLDNTAAPMTPDTVFSIMSIAKSFTATAIMQLAEKMIIGLDDPVSKYLPYFQLQDELFIKNPITIKQLLSHTAGFPEYIPIASLKDKNLLQMYRGIPQYKEIMSQFSDEVLDKIKSREDVTRYFTNVKLQYKPGEGWQYCTDAYVIAGDLLEKVTGITWEEYLHNNIFSRLQLHRTFTDPVQLRQETDQTHYYTFDGSRIREVPTPMNPICAPAGFIYSTVNDITKYLLSHMDFVKSPLLNEKSLITMQDMIAKRSVNLGYGLGWKIRSYLDIKIVEHGGGYPGVAAYVAMIPSMGFGVVLFSNCDQVPVKEICEKVTNEFIEESLF